MPTSIREYAILYVGGRAVISGAIVGGGNAVLTTGQHALDGPEHTGQLPIERLSTTELDTALVLHPDGAGNVVWGVDATGGPEAAFDHGNMGATETIDLADGTWHRGTLNADCTITVTGFTVDEGLVVICEFSEDGTGGWGITWDPDVVFIGDDQPDTTAATTTFFLLWSSAGDSTIYGGRVAGGSSVGALDDLSDVTITSPAADEQLQYIGGVWVNNARRWEPVTSNPGTGPEMVFSGDEIVMTWATY